MSVETPPAQLSTEPPPTATPSPEPQTTHTPPPPYPFSQQPCTLLTQGAEALVYSTYFLDHSTPAILKVRPSKPYRHPILDKRLTRQRVLAEARVLIKLSSLPPEGGLRVPAVYGVDYDIGRRVRGLSDEIRNAGLRIAEQHQRKSTITNFAEPLSETASAPPTSAPLSASQANPQPRSSAWLLIELIPGPTLKSLLRESTAYLKSTHPSVTTTSKQQVGTGTRELLQRIGYAVGLLHLAGVIHGDLTSSNFIVRQEAIPNGVVDHPDTTSTEAPPSKPDLHGTPTPIDFGLSTQASTSPMTAAEDRAVDLYVLERAFGSTHPGFEEWFSDEVLGERGYKGAYLKDGKGVECERVTKRLEEVRMRGRKRSMVG
jgi:TP53 regulating kinase and related kinases